MLIRYKIIYTLVALFALYACAYAQQSPSDVQPTVATVSSASYALGAQARGSIVTSFGQYIHPAKITIKDKDGTVHPVTTIFGATDLQVNYLIPDDVPVGPATFSFTNSKTNEVIQSDR